MNPNYTWVQYDKHAAVETPSKDWFIKRQKKTHVLQIMGAPIGDTMGFRRSIQRLIDETTTLCISGELKESFTSSPPASNYRFKKDERLNMNVVTNYLELFEIYYDKTFDKPVFVNTIPRNWRLYSWKFEENGDIIRKDEDYRRKIDDENDGRLMADPRFRGNKTVNDKLDTDILDFLLSNGVTKDNLVKIRESCKGSKYQSYLIDMISQIYELYIDSDEFHDIYHCEYRVPVTDDNNQLYFDKTKGYNGMVFFTPKNDSVKRIYIDFSEAINLKENKIKKSIREYLINHRIDRWTDFDVNDTDDAFTVIMLIHSFKGLVNELTNEYYKPDDDEKIILESLEEVMKPWYDQL